VNEATTRIVAVERKGEKHEPGGQVLYLERNCTILARRGPPHPLPTGDSVVASSILGFRAIGEGKRSQKGNGSYFSKALDAVTSV